MAYLITDVDVISKNKKNYLKIYLSDLDRLYGPLCIRWYDYHISQPLSAKESDEAYRILRSRNIYADIRRFSQKKVVIHARGKMDVPTDIEALFMTAKPTDIIRLSYDNPNQCLELSPELTDFLQLQKNAHQTLRNIHEEAMDADDYKRYMRKHSKDDTVFKLVDEADKLLNSINPMNHAELSKDKLSLLGFLETAKGTKKTEEHIMSRSTLEEIIEKGKVALTDIELGDYDTDDPFIYLDTFVHFKDERTKGIVFGLYPIGSETLDTEDGPVPFIFEKDDLNLRRRIASYRFNNEFLFLGGHNILGFDEQKCLNPKRRKEKGRLKGDGIFRVSADNTQPRYYADSGGLEILRLNGAFLIDTYRITKNYFIDLMPDTKLETVMEWFGSYIEGFYMFKKSYRSYSDIEDDRRDWKEGDVEKGKMLSKYCYHDSKAPLFLIKEILPVMHELADSSGLDFFRASIASPSKLAENYWDRRSFRSMNSIPFRKRKETKEKGKRAYAAADDSFVEIISDTDVSSKYSLSKQKKILIEAYAKELSTKTEGLWMSYIPIFEDLIIDYDRRYDNPLLQIMQMRLNESIAIDPIIDLKRVHRGHLNEIIFFAKYGMDHKEFLSIVEDRVKEKTQDLPPIAACSGNYIFTEEPIDAIKLGKTDIIRIYDTFRRNVKPSVATIFNLEGKVSSVGIKIPSRKKREDFDPLKEGTSYLEIKFIYDFLETYFKDGIKESLRLLKTYSKEIMDFDPFDYLFTTKRHKLYYQDQNTFRYLILEEFNVKVRESITYSVGSIGKEDYVLPLQDKEEFKKKFTPMESFYRNLVFGGYKRKDVIRTNLFRIVSSLCFPYDRSDVEDEMLAYHRLKDGKASENDIDILCRNNLISTGF